MELCPVVSTPNSKYWFCVVSSVEAVEMPPLDPQAAVPSAVIVVSLMGLVIPAPRSADAATVEVDGAGVVNEKPVGNRQVANDWPHMPVPGGGALFTVSVAVAVWPVSTALMNRCPVVFTKLPVAVVVTLMLITQLPLPATVPLLNEIALDPAVAVSVGVPQPDVDAPAGVAIVMPAGRLSTKL